MYVGINKAAGTSSGNAAHRSDPSIRRSAGAEIRLLLLLSRPALDTAQARVAKTLADRVGDWESLLATAARKHSLPLVLRHLRGLGAPDAVLAAARRPATEMTMATLRVAAAHRSVLTDLLGGVRHCFFKGPSLAARYYGDPGIRYARDIDVLVEAESFASVIRRALDHGYRLAVIPESQPPVATERDLRALLRYRHVVTLISPDDVPVEIHREISKTSGLFEASELLAIAEETERPGGAVMPTDWLFVYLCYHDTRHTWSRLHWLADLDAIMAHPSFDLAATRAVAERIGLGPCLEAVLEMRRLAASPLDWDESAPDSRGGRLLDLCLENLSGDLARERDLRVANNHAGLPFPWLVTPETLRRLRRRERAARFRPDFTYYADWPLPDRLQWIYRLSIPAGAALRRMGRRG